MKGGYPAPTFEYIFILKFGKMLQKKQEENITEDEAALYDRQIRLWGLDAQRRRVKFTCKAAKVAF